MTELAIADAIPVHDELENVTLSAKDHLALTNALTQSKGNSQGIAATGTILIDLILADYNCAAYSWILRI